MGAAPWGCFILSLKALVNEIADLAPAARAFRRGLCCGSLAPQASPHLGASTWRAPSLVGSQRSVSCPGSVPALFILYSRRDPKVSKHSFIWKFFAKHLESAGGFPDGTVVKNLPASSGDTRDAGQSLGGEDSLEKEMATLSSILARKISWTEEPGRLQPWGCNESDTTGHAQMVRMIKSAKHWEYSS